MDVSLLSPASPSFTHNALSNPNPNSSLPLLSLSFARKSITSRKTHLKTTRRKLRIAVCSSAAAAAAPELSTYSTNSASIFGGKRELTGIEKVIEAVPPAARYSASVFVVAGFAAAGYALGFKMKGHTIAGLGGAVVLGAAGGAAAFAVNSQVPEVAAVSLHNRVVECNDPLELKREDVAEIAKRYGVSKENEAFNAELCDIYQRFVSSILPPDNENLKGTEVDMIVKFKNALGIDDPDAAAVHIELGRRIYRRRLETGNRDADIEQRRAFQKLVYVSTLVFGEASTFLLPWKRVFKVTDSQIEVAISDNSKRLYATTLKSIRQDIDEKQLIEARAAMLQYQVSDEIAAEMHKKHARKLLESKISSALGLLRSRNRGPAGVVDELEKILAFNNRLISLAHHPESSKFPPGIGPVSVLGGEYGSGRKVDDLKILLRAYVSQAFSSGGIEDNKISALYELGNIFGLGKHEAEAILLDVSTKVYRKQLGQAVTNGDLEKATSKAAFLENLCEKLHFDPEKASQLHADIYRQKLQQAVDAHGVLNEEDFKALLRLQVLLCIPEEAVVAAHSDICGSVFEKVVREVLGAVVDVYEEDLRVKVRNASRGLRLTQEVSLGIANKAVRASLMNFIRKSKAADKKTGAAKELKNMIIFNTVVVPEFISDIKGENPLRDLEPPVEETEIIKNDEPEWDSLQTLRKTRPNRDIRAEMAPGQEEITLKDDLTESEKSDLYRTYLLYCISQETLVMPLGGRIPTKKGDREFLLLNQLGRVLGMSNKEIVEVHRNMAEEAFKQQAQEILADGEFSKEKIEKLNELQKEVGLSPELAQKVIKGITSTKVVAAIKAAISQGKMDIKQIRKLKDTNIDLDSIIEPHMREYLFKKTVDEMFSSGTGQFDAEEIYEKLPSDLDLDAQKCRTVVHELAKNKLSNSLLQVVALLRQKDQKGVVSSLNDMLACDKALPYQPLTWPYSEEIADLYCVYVKSDASPDQTSRLQYLLGISDETAQTLRETANFRDLFPSTEEDFLF